MCFATGYLERHSCFEAFIDSKPVNGLGLIVVIPSMGEPALADTLQSLYGADRPTCPVEIIVVVNAPENASQEVVLLNQGTVGLVRDWDRTFGTSVFRFHVIDAPPFPGKHAGAGFARKTGMDEAVRRFNHAENPNGIIASFDADSLCDANYFTELEKCLVRDSFNGCAIYFEHPLEGDEHPGLIYEAVTCYELYLRYFIQALRYTGFPWAFHTVGSSFAVKAGVYVKQGGMNRRTAGEDFYFLHKIFPLGNFTELNTTRIIPSSRSSDRVPFGTGAAISKYIDVNQSLDTWPLDPFNELGELFRAVRKLPGTYNDLQPGLAGYMDSFLTGNGFPYSLEEMQKHSATAITFEKRFFAWFNAFRIIRFLNYSVESRYNRQPVELCAANLLDKITGGCKGREILRDCGSEIGLARIKLLLDYRKMQRNSVWRC